MRRKIAGGRERGREGVRERLGLEGGVKRVRGADRGSSLQRGRRGKTANGR